MKVIIASTKNWNKNICNNLSKQTGFEFIPINEISKLNLDSIKRIDPKFIFFPHWSYIIPAEIYENFECVIFHMTDVPFGRGGSPLQNLISKGIYETKISAIKCVKELDAGPVYLKRDFSLWGNAEEIYIKASKIIEDMIIDIIKNNPKPMEQQGEPVVFKRRTPEQSDVSQLSSLEQIFDYIRMLDADGYPKAFLDFGNFRLEFSRASMKSDKIVADVTIREKNYDE